MKAAEKRKKSETRRWLLLEKREAEQTKQNERLIVDYIIAQNDYLGFLFLELAIRRVD